MTWRPFLATNEISQTRMESIAFTPMPARLRNELITEAYGDIAEEMAELLGVENATWCSIGQWASSSIGDYLGVQVPSVGRLIVRAFGDGNRDVFSDIARAHVTFLETVGAAVREGTSRAEAWTDCRDRLLVSLPEPPSQPLPASDRTRRLLLDGNSRPSGAHRREILVRGFQAYDEAIAEPDAETRAQLILLGNSLLALHEQKLLGPAVSAGFRTWLRHLTTFWRPLETTYEWRNRAPGGRRLRLEAWWIRTATERFVRIELPNKTISTGQPLLDTDWRVAIPSIPPERLGAPLLESTASLELLVDVFESFHVDGRAATCWADLDDRMGFILAMFANEQRSPGFRNDRGGLVRPPVRRHLLDDRGRLERRLARTEPVNSGSFRATLGDNSPVAAHRLDELRRESMDPIDPELMDDAHQSVGDRLGVAETEAFRGDFFARLAAVSSQDGLLDSETVIAARRLFGDWSTFFHMGLLFRSLPDGYAAHRGVKVLGTVSELATNPVRRVGETAQFLNDLFVDEESWIDGRLVEQGPAAMSLRGVRVIHAMLSRQLMERGWDDEAYGVPINLEDLLGTMLSFVVPPFEMMEDIGVEFRGVDEDVLMRFWCGIGHLMGLPLDVLTVRSEEDAQGRRAMTYLEGTQLADLIRNRHHARSVDGVRLGEALVEGVADGFPRASNWAVLGLFDLLGSRRVNEMLLLTEGRGRRRGRTLSVATGLATRWGPTRWLTREAVLMVGRFWLHPFLDAGAARPFRRTSVTAAHVASRPPVLERPVDYWPVGCGPPEVS